MLSKRGHLPCASPLGYRGHYLPPRGRWIQYSTENDSLRRWIQYSAENHLFGPLNSMFSRELTILELKTKLLGFHQSRFVFDNRFPSPLHLTVGTYTFRDREILHNFVQMALDQLTFSTFSIRDEKCLTIPTIHIENSVQLARHLLYISLNYQVYKHKKIKLFNQSNILLE